MKPNRLMVMASFAVMVMSSALAQGGPGAGMGAGPGASAPGMGMGMGMGPGKAGGRGPGAHFGADYTPGWSLMTPAERTEHQSHMQSLKSADECKAYMAQHHEQMAARVKEKGGKPLAQPRRNACAGFKP